MTVRMSRRKVPQEVSITGSRLSLCSLVVVEEVPLFTNDFQTKESPICRTSDFEKMECTKFHLKLGETNFPGS